MKRHPIKSIKGMEIAKAILALIIAFTLIIVLNTKIGDIPPAGKFLDPFKGFWQNAESRNPVKSTDYKFDGLRGKVEVLFDDHMIPHIFADNTYDAFFAQGYVTA